MPNRELKFYKPQTFTNPEAAYNAGVAAAEAGNREAAVAHFRTATEMQRDYLEAYFNWGAMLLELGQAEEAIPVFEKGIAVDPEFPLCYFMLGTAYGALGDPRRAFFATVQGLRFAPNETMALANAGRAAFLLGAYTDSAVRYLLAIREHEEEHAHLINLGAALMHLTGVGKGELLGHDGKFALQDASSVARLALGLWCLSLDDAAEEQAIAVEKLDPDMAAKLRYVFNTQEGLKQSLFTLAAKVNADPTFVTDEISGGKA